MDLILWRNDLTIKRRKIKKMKKIVVKSEQTPMELFSTMGK